MSRLNDKIETFLAGQKEAGRTPNTVRSMRSALLRLEKIAKEHRVRAPSGITESIAKEVVQGGGPTEATQNARRSHLTAFFAWCIRLGYMEDNPAEKLRHRALRVGSRRLLSEDEVGKLVQGAASAPGTRGLRDRAIVEIMTYCGAYPQEISDLDIEDYSKKDKTLLVGHGGKFLEREIPLSKACCKAIDAWLVARQDVSRDIHDGPSKVTPAMFVNYKSGGRLSPYSVTQQVVKGSAERGGLKGAVNAHVIRGTVVARVHEEWGPGEEAQAFLGASSADYLIRQDRDRRYRDGGGTTD